MYQLKRFNVVKLTDNEAKKAEYLSQGYELIEEKAVSSSAEEVADTDDEPINIDKMTTSQLKEFAQLNEFDITGAKTKAEIIEKILSARNIVADVKPQNAAESEGEADDRAGEAGEA